jgi:hypothetical protein
MENDYMRLDENNMTTGIDNSDSALGSEKKKDQDAETFAGNIVFQCDDEVYHKCRLGKAKYARYKTFVGDDEAGKIIRDYGRKYPQKNIVLKNKTSGAMLYLRKNK